MSQIRRAALMAFKKLHRSRQAVFRDDLRALAEGRKQINETFRKNRNVTDEDEIKELIQLAKDVEEELRKNIIQAVEKQQGLYALRITEETTRLDNIVFRPEAVVKSSKKRASRTPAAKNDCCDCAKTNDSSGSAGSNN